MYVKTGFGPTRERLQTRAVIHMVPQSHMITPYTQIALHINKSLKTLATKHQFD